MKVAVLSDIHGNLEALQAVQNDLQQVEPEQVICLGDLVGYGPDPEEVVNLVREFGYQSILGNHEAALASKRARNWMNFQAKENNISTEALLSEDNLLFCCHLPKTITLSPALFVHGSPPDSVNTYLYMMDDKDIQKTFADSSLELFFVGHTHELMLVSMEEDKVIREHLHVGIKILEKGRQYLINCGSVGQPRDGDTRAKYLVWDREESTLEVRAVYYDVETTAGKIISRGFPRSYADRLR
jgi:predicted phosphodiesterase